MYNLQDIFLQNTCFFTNLLRVWYSSEVTLRICHWLRYRIIFFMSVYNSAWKDTTEWNAKETKMFCQYITRFTSKIQEIFRITVQPSDSEEEIKHKEDTFNFVTDELKRIMEKRHYVRNIISNNSRPYLVRSRGLRPSVVRRL